jgi:quercetin dioxygenase-like cupin family protein
LVVHRTPNIIARTDKTIYGNWPFKFSPTKRVTKSDAKETAVSELSYLKNIAVAEPLTLIDLVDYQQGRVVSRTFVQNQVMSLTLFAFDQGEGLSTHTAAGDAFVHILDGEALITIGGKQVSVKAGEVVAMPANVPHSLEARVKFKMLLVVVKGTG